MYNTYLLNCVYTFCAYATDCTLLLMRKIDDSGDFSRDWNDFKAGFSNDANYWLGNDQIHLLTKDGGCKLRVDLESLVSNARYWAEYSTFIVGSEATNYQVLIDGYSGDAGNLLVMQGTH